MKKRFDPEKKLLEIKLQRKKKKKRLNKEKRITKHQNSILFLLDNDASLSNIVAWLRQQKRIKTNKVYIHYLLNKKDILVQAEPPQPDIQLMLFDELRLIKLKQKRNRTRKFNYSRLDKYAKEILELSDAGASSEDIRVWLHTSKHLQITNVSIRARLKYWIKKKQELFGSG